MGRNIQKPNIVSVISPIQNIQYIHRYVPCSVEEKCLHTFCSIWRKPILITGSMGGAGKDPPSSKMGAFFLMTLTLTEPSFKNSQLNGAKCLGKKLFSVVLH